MNKDALKSSIAKYYPLYKIHQRRVLRLLRAPIHTGIFYAMNAIAHIYPYRITKKMPWGARMRFFLPEANQIYYYDFWELDLANFFINAIEPGDTFVDAGSHVGYYSSLAGALVTNSGKVIAIEPTPRTYESLVSNLKHLLSAITYNYALSDKEAELTFLDFGPAYSSFNSLHARKDIAGHHVIPEKITVKTKTLDTILTDVTPTFIKIDAEGAEASILRGAEMTLSQLRPIITFEVGIDSEENINSQEAIKILLDHRYSLFSLDIDGRLSPHEIQENYIYDNIVAVPEEKIGRYQHLMAQ